MNTALFFITHEGIASSLLNVGESIINKQNNNIAFVEIPMDADNQQMISSIENKLKSLNLEHGVVFFTDIYGSTPSNIAHQLAKRYDTELISGVNLPMVVRLLNYRDDNKKTLIQKALDGACKGIQKVS